MTFRTLREEIPSGGLRWFIPDEVESDRIPVFFAPGSFALSGPYDWIGEALTKAGYTVGMISLGIYDVLTGWEEGITEAKTAAYQRFGTRTYRIIGHSLGANGALVYAGPDRDCTAIVALCPAYAKRKRNVNRDLMNKACLSEGYNTDTLFIAGGVDTIAPAKGVEVHYNNLLSLKTTDQPIRTRLVTIDGAGHVQFMNTLMASLYELISDDVVPTVPTETVHDIVLREVLDWFHQEP